MIRLERERDVKALIKRLERQLQDLQRRRIQREVRRQIMRQLELERPDTWNRATQTIEEVPAEETTTAEIPRKVAAQNLQTAENNIVTELQRLNEPESPDESSSQQESDQDDSENEPYVIKADGELYFLRASNTSDEYDPESPEM